MAALRASLTCGFEFSVPLFDDGEPSPFQELGGSDVVDGRVEALGVDLADVASDNPGRFGGVVVGVGTDGVHLARLGEALDRAAGVRLACRRADMGHAGGADSGLDVGGKELGALVGDDSRRDTGVQLLGALDDLLELALLHGLPEVLVEKGRLRPYGNEHRYRKVPARFI
jgi:hypothetical protein